MTASVVTETNLGIGPLYRGKVRDCYRLDHSPFGPAMLIVSTDRISAFDWVLPTAIPDKGKVLTTISAFWFDWLAREPGGPAHHLLTTDIDAMGLPEGVDPEQLRGRTMLVRQADVIPFIDDMAARYEAADVVLCRAGAITVSELCVAGVPAILVPLVVKTTAHQRANAEFMASHGAALHLPQTELSAASLANTLISLDRARLLTMAHSAQAIGRPNATRTVADAIEHIAEAAR